jgi:K+-sensing histidine kinase KdpD
MALSHGLRACWSTPIPSSSGTVLGTFAIHYDEPKSPTPLHHSLIEQFTHIASIAVERARGEEALSRARSELAHMTRVTTLGALAASIAHEVSQPLSGIVTNSSTCLRMLGAEPPNVEGARETVRRTIRDGHRASEVITRLRALFGNKGSVDEPVDLNDAAREVIALSWNELQRSRIVPRTELAANLPPVRGDRVQLQQVMLNLILNAADAMSGVEDHARQLVVRTEVEEGGEWVRLSVQGAGAIRGGGPRRSLGERGDDLLPEDPRVAREAPPGAQNRWRPCGRAAATPLRVGWRRRRWLPAPHRARPGDVHDGPR